MACQREDCRVGLAARSVRRAARAPEMVFLRARSSWRAWVEDSCSMISAVGCGAAEAGVGWEVSPTAVRPRLLPKR